MRKRYAAYRDALAAIRRQVGDGLVLQITSEALGRYSPQQQMAVIREVRPEAVSLALREFAPDAAHESEFAEFLAWLAGERVIPQIILYAPDEMRRLDSLRQRGLLDETFEEGKLQRDGLFNAGFVRRLLEDHWSGRADHRKTLWTLLTFQLWYDRWGKNRI